MAENAVSISRRDYVALAEFRHQLRRFLEFSERAARQAGLTPQQHQLLLALKGAPAHDHGTIKELAERLRLRPHSIVGLVDRCEQLGLVERRASAFDLRLTEVHVTSSGEALLEQLSRAHRDELCRSVDLLHALQSIVGEPGHVEDERGAPR